LHPAVAVERVEQVEVGDLLGELPDGGEVVGVGGGGQRCGGHCAILTYFYTACKVYA